MFKVEAVDQLLESLEMAGKSIHQVLIKLVYLTMTQSRS